MQTYLSCWQQSSSSPPYKPVASLSFSPSLLFSFSSSPPLHFSLFPHLLLPPLPAATIVQQPPLPGHPWPPTFYSRPFITPTTSHDHNNQQLQQVYTTHYSRPQITAVQPSYLCISTQPSCSIAHPSSHPDHGNTVLPHSTSRLSNCTAPHHSDQVRTLFLLPSSLLHVQLDTDGELALLLGKLEAIM